MWLNLEDKMVSGSDLSTFRHLKKIYRRVFSFGNSIFVGSNSFFPSINELVAIGSLLTFLLAVTCAYFYLFPNSHQIAPGYAIPSSVYSIGKCNLFEGKWVIDGSYPLYNASECPFAEQGFNCLANGRKDEGYLKWRWKPKNCDIPRFNVHVILEHLRGKRLVFVGDSLSRTQWESLICMLITGIADKKAVYEVNGNQITKQIRFLGVKFSTYDFTVEYYRSVFLVLPGPPPRQAPKRVKSTLRLDKLDDVSKEWADADILIFNTGHWWTKTKLFQMGSYFQMNGSLKLGMPIMTAFEKALNAWASWVDSAVNPNKTLIFFRTFESSHWSGGKRNTCKVSRHPLSRTKGREQSPISDIIIKVVKNMPARVTPLHVTPMGAYRSDAHVGTWSDDPTVPDCSHWCLPGVPDMWNEILFTYLLDKGGISP